MNFTQDDLTQAVGLIKGVNCAPPTIDLVRNMIENGASSRLVTAIMASERSSNQSEERVITRTMHVLESFAATAPTLACILMCDLWGIANDRFMHDVCDSIDLWIHDCDSDDLTRHLKTMAQSAGKPGNRRHFEELLRKRGQV
jgi:hypothetical protein